MRSHVTTVVVESIIILSEDQRDTKWRVTV